MTYETAIAELFDRFPDLRARYDGEFTYMDGEATPYLVFGSLLIPSLEAALERHDLKTILTICAYLEDAAESARDDAGLRELLRVEVGEWLGGMANEELLAPWLGTETKKVCRYVPGLAAQRREIPAQRDANRMAGRVTGFLKKLFGR